MTTTLITGANKGLGFETARRLTAAGHTVYAAARTPEKAGRAARELGARPLVLDVTDEASVAAAAARVEEQGGLDVLVNNAGISGHPRPAGAFTAADLNGHHGSQTVEEGAEAIVRAALLSTEGPTGTFSDAAGVSPW
ncbi:SDR family NAD(P)-dependent oxidoreductase [Streptomyces sp. DR3-1]|uniref:SDR family NAD(P)-dependent oxidoreductase n=1 Tax=Streptomyces sp. DR3-1 TaxID=2951169 RepID=UPI002042DCBE|nr:SDR family NAD(P)-dependent oxidoreductase [Streptomyces sp. DR3-1]MCM3817093.1 SDR family NAD(P)-dependent oxidoreductase [Streptomyces sp. DR3-1]